ncbi:MAG TPA: DUF1667 domain-containing protein [Candidatus Mediterraneibacter stercoripullorum]|nr:DUF1667 domain-containing protein [Candidatus Mediterraneibacter stercoripullorum]
MLREFICIMCPQGCSLQADEENGKVLKVSGNTCPRGKEYAIQEITAPMRNIATSVKVENGELPLASVRLTGPIPKSKIFSAMDEIRKICVKAPVKTGDIVIENLLGTGENVIITKDINKL